VEKNYTALLDGSVMATIDSSFHTFVAGGVYALKQEVGDELAERGWVKVDAGSTEKGESSVQPTEEEPPAKKK
jgi:hypothetical protein